MPGHLRRHVQQQHALVIRQQPVKVAPREPLAGGLMRFCQAGPQDAVRQFPPLRLFGSERENAFAPVAMPRMQRAKSDSGRIGISDFLFVPPFPVLRPTYQPDAPARECSSVVAHLREKSMLHRAMRYIHRRRLRFAGFRIETRECLRQPIAVGDSNHRHAIVLRRRVEYADARRR